MAEMFVKSIKETGFVISKKIKPAREAGVGQDGSRWDASPEEYIIDVISCSEDDLSKTDGFVNGTRNNYKVDKVEYEKYKFGDFVKVKYVATQNFRGGMILKTQSIELMGKNVFTKINNKEIQ